MEQLIPSDLEKTMKKSKGVPKEKCPIADGITVRLKLSPGGAMLTEDKGVELSVQMGLLATKLKCKMHGEEGGLKIQHPQKGGVIKVVMTEGCPHVQKGVSASGEFKEEEEWMSQPVDQHPVLRSLPDHIRQRLAVEVGGWDDLPSN